MRAWIINQYSYTPSLSASTRHYALGKELVERGHDVLVIATSFYHKSHRETKLKPGEMWKYEVINDVPFLWLRTCPYSGNNFGRLYNMLTFTLRLYRQVGLQKQPGPDIIMGSSPHLFAAWAAERLASKYKAPFFLEIRDLWPQNLVEMGGMSSYHPLIWTMKSLETYLYKRCDKLISAIPISRSAFPKAKSYFKARGANVDKFEWVPNSVDLSMIPDVVLSNKTNDPFTFIYAGAHSLYGGLDIVLGAAEILQGQGWEDKINIRLIGDGPKKPLLLRRASEHNIKMVTFEEPVPKSEIYEHLQQADACLMIYNSAPICRWGISPNKLYDYMAVGRPVLYALGKEYSPVREAEAGISVEAGDPNALADGMKAMASTSLAERQAMGARARAFIEKYHNIVVQGEKLERLLESQL